MELTKYSKRQSESSRECQEMATIIKKRTKNSSNLIFLYILNALNTLYSYHRQCYFILSDFICFASSYKYKNEIVKKHPETFS